MLLAWSDLIQREDQILLLDIIYLVLITVLCIRSKQLGCEREFLKLSRNKGDYVFKSRLENWKG